MMRKTRLYTLPLLSIVFILALLLEPTTSIGAAKTGLLLWFNTVLPSLVPFIIGANMLMASGGIHFFEKLFKPIMKPVFNVPACCAFPWVIGLISGYPMGAKIAGELYDTGQITQVELQRLLSFCNNSGPFFILGAVGVGMLGNQSLGYSLLGIHIASSILVGVLFRFYGQSSTTRPTAYANTFKPSLSFGEALGKSVSNAMDVIVQVGGYIIIFSVIYTLIQGTSLVTLITNGLYERFAYAGMTKSLAASWLGGLIELSNGAHLVASSNSPLSLQLPMISFILGWGGLCVHAQSLGFIKKSGVKAPVYLLAKFLHGAFAFILTLIFILTA